MDELLELFVEDGRSTHGYHIFSLLHQVNRLSCLPVTSLPLSILIFAIHIYRQNHARVNIAAYIMQSRLLLLYLIFARLAALNTRQ